MNLDGLFYPRAVAIVGSMTEGKLGHVLARNAIEAGFSDTYAVNPRAQGIEGVMGFQSVSEIPGSVDLAVIASPASTVVDVLEDCGKAGVNSAVIITSGFAETGNKSGESAVLKAARKHNIRFIGPNCAGIVNTAHKLFLTLESYPPPGRTALLSQSGALGGAILAWANAQGLGFSKFVSYGNRADLDEVDLLNYLAEDSETDVVAFYIESLADGRRFMEAASAFTKKKPLVVIKAGRTQTGLRATLSHTGSMAGSDSVYDSAFRQAGAIRVQSVEEMFDLCKGFTSLPPVLGKKLCIVTNSGGPGVLAADHADHIGLQVSEPGTVIKDALSTFLPQHCSLRNPIDLTVEGTEEGFRKTLDLLLQDYDAALAINVGVPYLPSLPLARGICASAESSGKPVAISFMADEVVADSMPYLASKGMPNFPTGERAVTALAYMARHSESQARKNTSFLDVPSQQMVVMEGTSMLEPDAMRFLKENGIPVPTFAFAETESEALRAGQSIGYPLVMKVVSPDILHKSEVGGVVLNIADDGALLAAYARLKSAADGKVFKGVVIYPMIRAEVEVLMGLSFDPQFGPVVAFGLGGIFTEILRDIALRVAPVDHDEAYRMIREIKGIPLLEGARGRKSVDLNAVAETLAKLSRLPFLYPAIREVDLNPVFLFERGLLVGDVRILMEDSD